MSAHGSPSSPLVLVPSSPTPTVTPIAPPAPSAPATGGVTLPATGVVLVGTQSTVRWLAANLSAIRTHTAGASHLPAGPCIPTGCILVNRLPEPLSSLADVAPFGAVMPPVLGYLDELIGLHARWQFKLAVVCLPATMTAEVRRLGALARQLSIPLRIVPTFADTLAGRAASATAPSSVGAVDVAGLIGRTPWGVDKAQVSRIIREKRVLITGAGGSIGSELARVCAAFKPSQVILLERSENALFEIDQHLGRRFPTLSRKAVLHDVVDAPSTAALLQSLRPDVVFHAAAHKHVPLMEDHPAHAVNNNLFGTQSIADAAVAAGVGRLVMISSDKAVNPTSVMGATKRLAEMYIQHLATQTHHRTRLSMVRFGNVLASACSVIPIWSQQMAEGHPLTVTDPRMTRYFMTIPEAATLVVQAGALEQATGQAPVYVLDMGEPISILEMAVRFLRQQGLAPTIESETIPPAARSAAIDAQIATLTDDEFDVARHRIVFSGARPGEKLYEELAYSAEMLQPTKHPAIGQWQGRGVADMGPIVAEMQAFRSPTSDKSKVVDAIRRHVPEMQRDVTTT
jgi:FlaA1/EpsC-like NDP-sugar epimerase